MNSATFLKSSSIMPLEVRAGEPNRRPLGRRALLSPTRAMTHQRMETFTETKAGLLFFKSALSRGPTKSCMYNYQFKNTHTDTHSTWTGVLITSNGTGFQNLLRSSSIGPFGAKVKQDQMVVRAAYTGREEAC